MARILVIDDQEPIRRIVRRTLEHEGHDVGEASDGKMGVHLLRQDGAAIVISDIFMPGQDGIQTLLQIRREFPGPKVLIMSGGDTTGQLDLREGVELLGAVQTLQKPFSARALIDAVNSALA